MKGINVLVLFLVLVHILPLFLIMLVEKNRNEDVLKANIRALFKKNRFETNPEKIEALREQAMLALSNYLVHEAHRMAREGQISREQIDVDTPVHPDGH